MSPPPNWNAPSLEQYERCNATNAGKELCAVYFDTVDSIVYHQDQCSRVKIGPSISQADNKQIPMLYCTAEDLLQLL